MTCHVACKDCRLVALHGRIAHMPDTCATYLIHVRTRSPCAAFHLYILEWFLLAGFVLESSQAGCAVLPRFIVLVKQ
jgi:hypothetical protein